MQLTGKLFLEMTISAANLLESRKEEINNLNVFPVPDGDTGVNMSMTIGGARQVLLPGGRNALRGGGTGRKPCSP